MFQASDTPYRLYNQGNSIEPYKCGTCEAPGPMLAEPPVPFARGSDGPNPWAAHPPPPPPAVAEAVANAPAQEDGGEDDGSTCEDDENMVLWAVCLTSIVLILIIVLV